MGYPAKAIWLVVGTSHQGPECSPESESTNKSSFCSHSGSRMLLGLGCEQSLLSSWGQGLRGGAAGGGRRESDTPGLGDSDRLQGLPMQTLADPTIWEDCGGPRGPIPCSLLQAHAGGLCSPGSIPGFSEHTKGLGKPPFIHSFGTHMANPGRQKALWTLEE